MFQPKFRSTEKSTSSICGFLKFGFKYIAEGLAAPLEGIEAMTSGK